MVISGPGPYIMDWSVISPLGVGRESFVDGLREGRTGSYAGGRPHVGYPVAGFDPAALIGTKGTRTLDRMTLMVIATSTMVLRNPAPTGSDDGATGLVLGTSTGSVASITDFLRDTFVQDKPYFVNPALFPNTVMNNAAGRTAIWHGLRGLNSTVSGGHVTGLAALRYATRMLRRGYADTLLVGGVEELSEPVAWAAHRVRARSARPLGEGCGVFLVQSAQVAARSGRQPLAEIVDFEFGVVGPGEEGTRAQRLAETVGNLLDRTGTKPADLWLVSLAQSGDGDLDAAEQAALGLADLADVRGIAPARQIGNTFSALGTFQLAAVLATAEGEGTPPDGRRPCLITSLGLDGAVAAALVRA